MAKPFRLRKRKWSDYESKEMNAVTWKDSSPDQNNEAKRSSDSIIDLVDNSKGKYPSTSAPWPLCTVLSISSSNLRATCSEIVAVQRERILNRHHRRVTYGWTTCNWAFAKSDQHQ